MAEKNPERNTIQYINLILDIIAVKKAIANNQVMPWKIWLWRNWHTDSRSPRRQSCTLTRMCGPDINLFKSM